MDHALNVVARANREFPQIYPQPGWVEHDPEAIWQSVEASVADALESAGVQASDIDLQIYAASVHMIFTITVPPPDVVASGVFTNLNISPSNHEEIYLFDL